MGLPVSPVSLWLKNSRLKSNRFSTEPIQAASRPRISIVAWGDFIFFEISRPLIAGRTRPSTTMATSPRQSKKGSLLLKLIVLGFLMIGGGLALLGQTTGQAPGDGTRKIEFEIPPGAGMSKVSRDLEQAGLISSSSFFQLLLRATSRAGKLKVGVYELNDGMSAYTIADVLTKGKVKMLRLTIPEGWTNRQIGDYFAEKGLVEDRAAFLALARDPGLLAAYKIPADTTEGYLFPETYTVPRGYPARKIVEAMLKRFAVELAKLDVPADMPPAILHERVILASIVEREAVRPAERPVMAQVFINRLEKRMRLESCATIQYLLDKPRPRLYEKDLKIESPYNTYRNDGLPPGPVSNPGLPALRAAFQPVPGPYLFFLLKPDGSHQFSVTYKDHLEAKRKYLGS